MEKQKPRVIAVVGPTASGKTDYALALAEKISGEIVSADSRLIYKGFDIGTAKPTIEERKSIPHYMIDIVEPEVDYSAGLYTDEAAGVIDNIIDRGRVPVVVGGTGLYFRLLLENYDVPKVEPDYELRTKLMEYVLKYIKDEKKYYKFFVLTEDTNIRACKLYQKCANKEEQILFSKNL